MSSDASDGPRRSRPGRRELSERSLVTKICQVNILGGTGILLLKMSLQFRATALEIMWILSLVLLLCEYILRLTLRVISMIHQGDVVRLSTVHEEEEMEPLIIGLHELRSEGDNFKKVIQFLKGKCSHALAVSPELDRFDRRLVILFIFCCCSVVLFQSHCDTRCVYFLL